LLRSCATPLASVPSDSKRCERLARRAIATRSVMSIERMHAPTGTRTIRSSNQRTDPSGNENWFSKCAEPPPSITRRSVANMSVASMPG
jgi:hypothetical protein